MNDTQQIPAAPTPDPAPEPTPASSTGGTPPPFTAGPGTYAPPAPMLESESRTIAMLVHVIAVAAMILSAGTLAFIVPLVMWLIYRERSALIDHHGKLNLNLQLTTLVVVIGGVVLGIVTIGIGFLVTIPLMIGYGIYAVVMSILAAIRANNGELYRIPLVIPFVR